MRRGRFAQTISLIQRQQQGCAQGKKKGFCRGAAGEAADQNCSIYKQRVRSFWKRYSLNKGFN